MKLKKIKKNTKKKPELTYLIRDAGHKTMVNLNKANKFLL